MQPVIKAESLSKLYHLGVINSTTLRDSVERWWYGLRGKTERLKKVGGKNQMINPSDPQAGPYPNSLWALKDISFSVKEGEVLGLIGKNGAGKSTLLKILTRITEPTSGKAFIRGRIASLLEVGTGFHKELTGRENIFLNGAILGMTKAEIKSKLDEIIAFSGVEKYVDTPVKRYSSGMMVRLAFAVAAHLEPEILLIDEVLAVGDAEFQKKCLGKMEDVAQQGRTVIFVSHQMSSISRLCQDVIWLDRGRYKMRGPADSIIQSYLSHGLSEEATVRFPERETSPAQFLDIEVVQESGEPSSNLLINIPFRVKMRYTLRKKISGYRVNLRICLPDGLDLLNCSTTDKDGELFTHDTGTYQVQAEIPASLIVPGRYYLTCSMGQPGIGVLDKHENVLSFQLVGKSNSFSEERKGLIAYPIAWQQGSA